MDYEKRKRLRIENYDYSQNGLYFVTICTKNRIPCLSRIIGPEKGIVGEAALGLPHIELTDIGKIVDENINRINTVYEYAAVLKYIIMPDHLHMDWAQSPMPNPQSPIPNPQSPIMDNLFYKTKCFNFL